LGNVYIYGIIERIISGSYSSKYFLLQCNNDWGALFLDVQSISFVVDGGDELFYREYVRNILFVLIWPWVLAFQRL
jgi:hypothetical protein